MFISILGKLVFLDISLPKWVTSTGKTYFFPKSKNAISKCFINSCLSCFLGFFNFWKMGKKSLVYVRHKNMHIFTSFKNRFVYQNKKFEKIFSNLRKSEFLCFGSFVWSCPATKLLSFLIQPSGQNLRAKRRTNILPFSLFKFAHLNIELN